MELRALDHPLVSHKVTLLRSVETGSPVFRQLVEELVTLLAYEATRGVRVEPHDIVTPVSPTTGVRLSAPKPLMAALGSAQTATPAPATPDKKRKKGKKS